MSDKPSYGLLLVNIGTPAAPEPGPVGEYLTQFLMDPRVIDIPWIVRWPLVKFGIVAKRKYLSAEAYRSVWTDRGSPLMRHSEDLRENVAAKLGLEFAVEIGMRYGEPSIQAGLLGLKDQGVREILVFPLYPQYAESSSLTAVEHVQAVAKKTKLDIPIRFIKRFHSHPGFISAISAKLQPVLAQDRPDHVLMSFHGLPVRHIEKTDLSGGKHCLKENNCCDVMTEVNRDCYRAQCFATARLLAAATGLTPDKYTVSFQSRLGRTPWIEPFTDFVLPELAAKGVKKLAVVCPSFVADCLETVEEMGIRGAEIFLGAGGGTFHLVPCLNGDANWAEAVAAMARDALPK
jgi:ferrochelatase